MKKTIMIFIVVSILALCAGCSVMEKSEYNKAELLSAIPNSSLTPEYNSYPCSWSGYSQLLFCAMSGENVIETITIPVVYFSESTGVHRVIFSADNARFEIFKDGDQAIKVACPLNGNTNLQLYVYAVR